MAVTPAMGGLKRDHYSVGDLFDCDYDLDGGIFIKTLEDLEPGFY